MATTRSSFRIFPCEYFGVFSQGLRSVVWPDCEYGREAELQLLASHSLKGDFEVERADGYDGVLLPWVDKCLLDDVDVWYATSSDPTQISESAMLVQGGSGVAKQGLGGEEVLLLLLKNVYNSLSMPNREDKPRNVRTQYTSSRRKCGNPL